MGEREHRKRRLTPEQKWQIFQEASRKNTTDAEVCRRWGIQPHQLRVIRERAKDASLDAFKKGTGQTQARSHRDRPRTTAPADQRSGGFPGSDHLHIRGKNRGLLGFLWVVLRGLSYRRPGELGPGSRMIRAPSTTLCGDLGARSSRLTSAISGGEISRRAAGDQGMAASCQIRSPHCQATYM